MPQSQITEDFRIYEANRIPIDQKYRTKTDFCCTIFFAAYMILLAIILFFVYNQQNLNKITYPNDSEGRLCGYDLKQYPYLYYPTISDGTRRVCVSECPKKDSQSLECNPTSAIGCFTNKDPKYQVQIYDSYLEQARIGLFCLPTDENLKAQVLAISNVQWKYEIYSVMDAFWMSAWIAIILGVLSFTLLHFKPYYMVPWTILLGGIFATLFGVFLLIFSKGYFVARLIIAIVFFWFSYMSIRTLYDDIMRQSTIICARLVHASTLHNKQDTKQLSFGFSQIKELGKPFLLILCFIIIYALFFLLNLWEMLSVWSCGTLQFSKNDPFYTVVGFGSNVLMLLVGFQLIWGASFIKQAYNFIASSNSAHWYYRNNQFGILHSVQLLLKYHWGSVVGGSLLHAFFYFVDLVIDFFDDDDDIQNRFSSNSKDLPGARKTYQISDQRQYDANQGCFKSFFSLVRGEALAYTSLVSIPYCDSARYCQFLSFHSKFFNYGQTVTRVFRINQHLCPIFIVLCIAMLKMGSQGNTPYGILVITVLTFFIVTYFLAYHGDRIQGLTVSTYVDESLNQYVKQAPALIKKAYDQDLRNAYFTKESSFSVLGKLLTDNYRIK